MATPHVPPSTADWEAFKELILFLYETRRQTARKTVRDLREHGFIVSEKMLRDRLGKWQIRNRNVRRKDRNMRFVVHRTLERWCPGQADPVFTFQGEQISFESAFEFIKQRYPTSDALRNISRPGTPPGMIVRYPTPPSTPLSTPELEFQERRFFSTYGHWFDQLNECKNEQVFGAFSKFDDAVFRTSLAFRSLSRGQAVDSWHRLREACNDVFEEIPTLPPDAVTCLFWHMANWIAWLPSAANIVLKHLATVASNHFGLQHPVTLLARLYCQRCPTVDLCTSLHAVERQKSGKWNEVDRARMERFHLENTALFARVHAPLEPNVVEPRFPDIYDIAWEMLGPQHSRSELSCKGVRLPEEIDKQDISQGRAFSLLLELAFIKRCMLDYAAAEQILQYLSGLELPSVDDDEKGKAMTVLRTFREEQM